MAFTEIDLYVILFGVAIQLLVVELQAEGELRSGVQRGSARGRVLDRDSLTWLILLGRGHHGVRRLNRLI